MTLIVGKLVAEAIYIMSDTRWTTNNPIERENVLKVFFLDRYHCIAYAGITEHAHKIIWELNRDFCRRKDTEALIRNIASKRRTLQEEGGPDKEVPDFILGVAGDSPRLVQFRGNREQQEERPTVWIGNQDGFSKFQEECYSSDQSQGELTKPHSAFRRVVDEGGIAGVGGYVICAKGSSEGFKFIPHAELNSPSCGMLPLASLQPDAEGWYTVDFGTAATGGFAYTSVTPTEPGANGYGFYFFQGKFGCFYRVDLNNDIGERLTANAPNVHKFIEIIEAEIDTRLQHGGDLGQGKVAK